MSEWLNMQSMREVSNFSKQYGPHTYQRYVLQTNPPRMINNEHFYIMECKNLHSLYSRIIEVE